MKTVILPKKETPVLLHFKPKSRETKYQPEQLHQYKTLLLSSYLLLVVASTVRRGAELGAH